MIDWIFIHLDKFHVATFRDCAIYFALAYLIIFSIIFLYVYRFWLTVLIFHRFPFIFRHMLIHFPFALFRSPSLHFQNSFPSISLYLWSFPLSSFIVTNFDILDFPTYRGLRHLLSTGIIEHIFKISCMSIHLTLVLISHRFSESSSSSSLQCSSRTICSSKFLLFSPLSCVFIHFLPFGGILLCTHVLPIILTHWGELRDLLGHRPFHVCTCWWLRHLLCTGLCSLMLLYVY